MKKLLLRRFWIITAIVAVSFVSQAVLFWGQHLQTLQLIRLTTGHEFVVRSVREFGGVAPRLTSCARIYCVTKDEQFYDEFTTLYDKYRGVINRKIDDKTYLGKQFHNQTRSMIDAFRDQDLTETEFSNLNQADALIAKMAEIARGAMDSVRVAGEKSIQNANGEPLETFPTVDVAVIFDRDYDKMLREVASLIQEFDSAYNDRITVTRNDLRNKRVNLSLGFVITQFAALVLVLSVATMTFFSWRRLAQTESQSRMTRLQDEHERQIDHFIDHSANGVLVVDRNFVIQRSNRVIEELYSSMMPILGHVCYERVYGLKEPCPGCPVAETFQTGCPSEGKRYNETLKKHLVTSSSPLFDTETGDLTSAFMTVRDISEQVDRKRIQHEHDEFVKNVFACIQDGIFVIDREHTILQTNPAFDRMFAARLPIVGKKCWETSGLDSICKTCPAEKMFQSGCLEHIIHEKVITADRPPIWVEHFSHPLVSGDGEVVGGINFIRDITQRKAMEDSLYQYQHELEALVQERTAKLEWSESKMNAVLNGSVPILFYDTEGTIESTNLATQQLLGFSESELREKKIHELYREYAREQGLIARNQLLHDKVTSLRVELPMVHKNGRTIWADCSLSVVKENDDGNAQIVGLCLDITEKHKLINKLEYAHHNAERACLEAERANQAKSEFLANMSHEIRTPMNAILGMTYLCLKTQLTATQRDYLEKSQAATAGLLGVINDILDFSKIEAGKLEMEEVPFSLGQVLQEVNDVLEQRILEKDLTLQTTLDASIPDSLLGDPLRLKQILLNLVGNAVKFTNAGGVTIHIARKKTDPSTGDSSVNKDANESVVISFAIQDTGIGMTPDQISRLFSAFTQADTSTTRQYGGTGLGLVIAKNLVELMGGQMEVSSVPNIGTTFRFTARFTTSDFDPDDEDSGSGQGTGQIGNDIKWAKVLLVEDNKINQIVAKELLRSYGVNITIANDGLEAVGLVKTSDFDLILMDVQMPNMDGLEATRAIRKMDKPGIDKLPILAMTAHAMQSDFEQSLAAGMNDHLTKPIDPAKLRKALTKWLGK